MSELSTPTVGLEVKEQRAQMEAGPQVDVTGAMRGQPDWGALGEAGSNFGKTVTALFQDTAAKAEYLKYQQRLGDIERNYMFSNGNGSEEEIKKVQEETNKAWSDYKKATMNFNSKESMRLIDDANKYGVRYRDAILNTRAKFAEDYYQKNQNAVVAASAEDFVYALNSPGSKELQYAQNRLDYELNELLTHNGFKKDDPEYERVMREAKSAAVKSNIAFHVANRDWTTGWKNYTEYVKQGMLVGQDRTDALSMLQILKDQLAAKAASSSSGGTDNIAYALETGTLNPLQKQIATAKNVPAAIAADEQRYQAELANYNQVLANRNDALRNGATRLGDGSLITADGQKVPALPVKPLRKTRQQIYNEEYFKVEQVNAQNAQRYQKFGHVGAEVSTGLKNIRESIANDPDKLAEFSTFLIRATPEQLIAASGAFGADFAPQVVADLKSNQGDKKFSELVDYWRHGVTRSEADYAAAKLTAERMPMEDYQALQAEAATTGNTIGDIIAAKYDLPANVGAEVGLKLLKTYSDPDNSYASTRQREIIDNAYSYLGNDFAKLADIPEDQWKGFVKMPVVEKAIKGMAVEAINSVINGEELTTMRKALAQKYGGSPNDKKYIDASYDKYQINYELQEQFREKFGELVEEYLERQQEELDLEPVRVTTTKVSYGGKEYLTVGAQPHSVGGVLAQRDSILAESNQAFASALVDAYSPMLADSFTPKLSTQAVPSQGIGNVGRNVLGSRVARLGVDYFETLSDYNAEDRSFRLDSVERITNDINELAAKTGTQVKNDVTTLKKMFNDFEKEANKFGAWLRERSKNHSLLVESAELRGAWKTEEMLGELSTDIDLQHKLAMLNGTVDKIDEATYWMDFFGENDPRRLTYDNYMALEEQQDQDLRDKMYKVSERIMNFLSDARYFDRDRQSEFDYNTNLKDYAEAAKTIESILAALNDVDWGGYEMHQNLMSDAEREATLSRLTTSEMFNPNLKAIQEGRKLYE